MLKPIDERIEECRAALERLRNELEPEEKAQHYYADSEIEDAISHLREAAGALKTGNRE